MPLMEYIERAAARKYDLSQIAGKLSYLHLMGKYLPWITEPAEQRLYMQRVAKAAGLPVETVVEQVRGKGPAAEASPQGFPRNASGGRPEERLLLRLLSKDPSLIGDMARDGVPELIEGEEVREVIALFSRRAAESEGAALDQVLDDEISDEGRKALSEEILRAEALEGDTRRIYPDVLLGLKIRKFEGEIARLGKASREAAGSGNQPLAQEMFTAQKAAKLEKERLERERRSRG
jgi:hypothetical protein